MWIGESLGEKKIRDVSIVKFLDIWQNTVEIGETLEEGLRRSQKRIEISKPSAGLLK